MGKAWSTGVPVVNVSRGTSPRHVTLIVPYYRCPVFFGMQLRHWASLPPDVSEHMSVIVVDDGSPEPAGMVLAVADARLRAVPIRLFRIEVDVPWNWLAARNIGANYAAPGWMILTDIDHIVPADTLRAAVYGDLDTRIVYAFSRKEHTGEVVTPHSASFLMTREMYWQIGGYDERLAGVYGTDGTYRKRVLVTAAIRVLTEPLIRYEFVDDASVTTYERKTEKMRAGRRRLFASVPQGPPKVLSFPYHEVMV